MNPTANSVLDRVEPIVESKWSAATAASFVVSFVMA